MATKVLSISCTSQTIKLCELNSYGANNTTIAKAYTLSMPQGAYEDGMIKNVDVVAATIMELINANVIKVKKVAFTIASSRVAVKEASLPKLPDKKLKEMIMLNISDYFPVNVDEYIVDYRSIEEVEVEGTKRIRAMLYAMPDAIVETYYALAAKLNLEIEFVDYIGNSIIGMFGGQVGPEHNIVIKIGTDETMILVFKNNKLQFQRNIAYGKKYMLDTKSKQETSEAAVYLTNNINRAIDFYISRSHDYHIAHIYLTGDSDGIDDFMEILSGELNVNVEQLEIKNGITIASADTLSIDPKLYISCISRGASKVNFVAKNFANAVKSQADNKNLKTIFIASVGMAVLLIGVALFNYITATSDRDSINEDIDKISGITVVLDDYYNAKDKYNDILSFVKLTGGNNDTLEVFIKDLEDKLPSDVTLKSINIINGAVTVSASTSSKETVAKLILQLEAIDYVSGVNVPSLSETIDDNKVTTVTFSFTCSIVPKITVEEPTTK